MTEVEHKRKLLLFKHFQTYDLEMKFKSQINEQLYLIYSKIKKKNTHLYWNLKKINQ